MRRWPRLTCAVLAVFLAGGAGDVSAHGGLPTNGHGQGYADLNFVIPELVAAIQYKEGTYFAEEGDFSAAGAIHMNYLTVLDRPIVKVEAGGYGYRRALVALSPTWTAGTCSPRSSSGRTTARGSDPTTSAR